jgi:hypothetical protein
MGEEIRSAYEIAQEKIEKLGEVTEEERLGWKYTPEGEKLAAVFIKKEHNLLAALNEYEEKARSYVSQGAAGIFIRHINLPENDSDRKNNKRAMDGLKTIKSSKVDVENIYSQIRRVFEHYTGQGEQQRKQAYESLKADFEAKLQMAMQQQFGTVAGMKIDVESQPQFQEEWRKLQVELDRQYVKLLDEYKQQLSVLS